MNTRHPLMVTSSCICETKAKVLYTGGHKAAFSQTVRINVKLLPVPVVSSSFLLLPRRRLQDSMGVTNMLIVHGVI